MLSANSTQELEATQPIRIGVVEFLNAAPLIDGLCKLESLQIVPAVPSSLIDLLESRQVDIAMCSSIDYQRSKDDLIMLPCGIVGSTGHSMTVRLFSSCAIDNIRTVACDTHSHTSVVLMQILLKRIHGLDVEVTALNIADASATWCSGSKPPYDAMMLIGDKVVNNAPPKEIFPIELDLGQAWHEYTKTSFCFAIWLAHADIDLARLQMAAAVLDRQRRLNFHRIEQVLVPRCQSTCWSVQSALEYTTQMLDYAFTDEHRRGLNLFFDEAYTLGFTDQRRPLVEL
mgnify:CR=1 FL=1